MKVLLVLGAGASRDLGASRSMPLMGDWSNALCEHLDAQESGLASACHLEPGLDGPTFEENLGLLLRWQQVRWLEERFEHLGGEHPHHVYNPVHVARRNTSRRMDSIVESINTTLYELFGREQIDDDKAKQAYGLLLEELGPSTELIVATTNYDRAAESALEMLGLQVDTGFERRPGMTPVLKPNGLIGRWPSIVPLLHLHGAVGWYERDGVVRDHLGDAAFNSTLGTPVVLYPDPDKDPTGDAIVSQLWEEFRQAVDRVELVLVIGHSLHDRGLVRELRRAVESGRTVAITRLPEAPGSPTPILKAVPKATSIAMRFGPDLDGIPSLGEVVREASNGAVRIHDARVPQNDKKPATSN